MVSWASETAGRYTSRQVEVVRGLALGLTYGEIADRLGIGARTVKAHAVTMMMKLRVRRARELPAAYYYATGDDPWPSRDRL